MSDTPTTEPEAPATPVAQRLREAQDKGYAGVDAAEEAGGIEALRTKHREATTDGRNTTGASEPAGSPGHPQDPTVRRSTTS